MSAQDTAPEQLLALVASGSASPFLLVDGATRTIAFANDALGRLFGVPAAALLGRPISEFEVGLEDMFFWEEVASGLAHDLDCAPGSYLHASGSTVHVQKQVRILGAPPAQSIALTLTDVSAELARSDETAEIASLLAATLESIADGVLVTDLSGGLRNFNRRFARMFGVAGSDLDGAAVAAAVAALQVDPAPWHAMLVEVADDPQAERVLTLALADDRFVECAARPQQLRGRPVGRLYAFSDVTDSKRYEAALLAAREASDRANQAKSAFIASMNHELKTPLNAILGFADLLREELPPAEAEFAQHIHTAGQHLLALIGDVLDLAQVEAGKVDLHPEQLDLAELMNECCTMTAPVARSFNVDIRVAPGLKLAVLADRRRTRQIVINLISNGCKYNRPGGSLTITATAAAAGCLALHFADTGIGIDAADLARIFEPFTRVGARRGEVEGTGLGLAHSRKLANLMGGDIAVQSTPGEGSIFTLSLPDGTLAFMAGTH
ncbi:PAS domain-containing sensor histidine kinase [Niveibacterium sp. 24ML]|uniref:PAS domain-containing sensor histidine kinase n=1 Tax=Niveibacterium sp. 24ML TaxID=2985512 RepID=UPI0022705EC0|nr:PAS domain-containing sensor histidine kinase [Niveibacterium sp. 24ML]MCX9156382.1 PAS domain-containing sensor histidine kinase [Niveibacterium sp. 24ML]